MSGIRVQLVRWGNSRALRIPKTVLEKAELREGDELEIRVEGGRITIEPLKPKLTLDELVDGITRRNLHGEQRWGELVGREVW